MLIALFVPYCCSNFIANYSGANGWGENAIGSYAISLITGSPGTCPGNLKNLFVSLLMSVLSQSLFTFVRRNFMTLSFFTTRHTWLMFLLNDLFFQFGYPGFYFLLYLWYSYIG